jgi:glycosyltransferase involved in cell wall biosynthesis
VRLAYLYSRYPVLSQTFCDTEMLALERHGFSLTVGSIYPPLTSIRHPQVGLLQAPACYAPPPPILRLWEEKIRAENRWPEALIATHEQKYGSGVKAATRARNATFFAELFTRNRVDHFHVHFANRAAHTALFLKAMANIPFSITAHGQDFMADFGNDDLLREICAAAEFVAVETEYSRGLMAQRCPESADKIHRVYNGMNLANFLGPAGTVQPAGPVRILSVGRLVSFKGFEYLIEACELLRQRSVHFRCEIIGDGPLRESLQQRIDELRLGALVTLEGALPQDRVIEKLERCDIFALASTSDDKGASDVFPTVILEAMASARAVVSTTMAGIPESVVDKETGLLVPAGESGLFADALEVLCRDSELRARYGSAGRTRIENHFQIETTVRPLIELFEKQRRGTVASEDSSPTSAARHFEPSKLRNSGLQPELSGRLAACPATAGQNGRLKACSTGQAASLSYRGPRIAYLIDRWPDDTLPSMETELLEVQKRNPEVTAFVCEFAADRRLTAAMKRLALQLEFLPDAMALEAEWQANPKLVRALEDDRANESPRAPADLFLRQARFALTLRRMFAQRNIMHVHATTSRALIGGVLLKKILGITMSASIEAKPPVSREVIEGALRHAVGGRIADRKLSERVGDPFIFDRAGTNRVLVRSLRWLKPVSRIDLTRRAGFWQEWAARLDRWSAAA